MDWSELQNWDEYTKLLIGLLAVTDPLGVFPSVLGLTDNKAVPEKKKIIRVSVFTFAITLLLFTFLGAYILDIFGITIAAFKIAGGLLFLFYALDMMGIIEMPTLATSAQPDSPGSLGIMPIGIPLLAGPGTISTIIIFADQHDSLEHKLLVSGVILTVALIVFSLYRSFLLMDSLIGEKTMVVLNRVMGLLLAAIAVEFILDGIVAHFPQLISVH
jgi:multiple antibiotic resistance protein